MVWILQIGKHLQHLITLCALELGWEIEETIKKLDVSGMETVCGELVKVSAMTCPGIRAEEALID